MSLYEFYKGKRVLVTGHTGFKGAWLCFWLKKMGAHITGYALPPTTSPSLHHLLSLDFPQTLADINDTVAFTEHLQKYRPEIIFHLAAQAIVRESYEHPVETFQSNIAGTWNFLDCINRATTVKAVLVVTSDKCYLNDNHGIPFTESDPLGGHDPYSASKACTEIICSSWRDSFWNTIESPFLATARAGNVIGGGDWAKDRLIPDAIRAIKADTPLHVRNPEHSRPWQHVLEPLHGYLLLGRRLYNRDAISKGAWNFSPLDVLGVRVSAILSALQKSFPTLKWTTDKNDHPAEASVLALSSRKSRQELGWMSRWNAEESVEQTAMWYGQWMQGQSPLKLCEEQIQSYMKVSLENQ